VRVVCVMFNVYYNTIIIEFEIVTHKKKGNKEEEE
jgi:hypothetical protein